jgi:two-component system, OmpR family, response regulator
LSKLLQTILYVEDETDIQHIVKLALEVVAGIRVIACSSGAEAIEQAEKNPVDLILLDVMMPQMDGPTTLSRLREIPALKNTPVVFMTAKAQSHEIAYFKSLGARDVIAKPFDPMELAKTLKDIWTRAEIPSIAPAVVDNISSNNTQVQNSPLKLQQQWLAFTVSWDLDLLPELHTSTHNLAGAGATFGYDELTTRARAVDRHFKIMLQERQQPGADVRSEVSELFNALEIELRRIVASLHH